MIRVGVGGIVVFDGKILLGRKGRKSSMSSTGECFYAGMFVTPGGGVEKFESLSDAIRREFFEETGLLFYNPKEAFIYEEIREARSEHFVLHLFTGIISNGEIRSGDDLEDVKWMSLDDCINHWQEITPCTKEIVRRYLFAKA